MWARLLNSASDALVTTMLDYYRLPLDFPGMKSRPAHGTPIQRVTHVEDAIAKHFDSPPTFMPFLVLHEFEAWLFSSPSEIPQVLTDNQNEAGFAQICRSFTSPEEINEGVNTAPSKRILQLFPRYRKTLHGPLAAQRIGLHQIRAQCPHFANWLYLLEQYAQS